MIAASRAMRLALATFGGALALAVAVPSGAQDRAATPQPAPQPAPQLAAQAAPAAKPRLILAISIDQFSADLFAQYREHFTGGFEVTGGMGSVSLTGSIAAK